MGWKGQIIMDATIRLARAGDARQILAIYAPFVEHTPTSFEIEVPSLDEMQKRIESTLAQFPWLVLEYSETVAGYAYASAHRSRSAYQWSVDVSVYVHPDFRRRKVAKALYTSLLGVLILQGYYNAFAGIALPNAASVGFHEAMGFQPIGVYRNVGYKLGTWHDVGWWQRSLREANGAPTQPQPLRTVMETPVWEAALLAGMGMAAMG
jgi:phosphinothricin acetyltransferase